ncbi:hypothetical protein ACFX13_012896 [Malus domestica]
MNSQGGGRRWRPCWGFDDPWKTLEAGLFVVGVVVIVNHPELIDSSKRFWLGRGADLVRPCPLGNSWVPGHPPPPHQLNWTVGMP